MSNLQSIDHAVALRCIREGKLWLRSLNLEHSHSYATVEDPGTGQRYALTGFIEDEVWEELARILSMRASFQAVRDGP